MRSGMIIRNKKCQRVIHAGINYQNIFNLN